MFYIILVFIQVYIFVKTHQTLKWWILLYVNDTWKAILW